jgi:diguanylate cyclase (GGDEF)-like protein
MMPRPIAPFKPNLDLLPGGCLVSSLSRQIYFANKFFLHEFGFDPNHLICRKLETIFSPASRIFYDSYLHPMLLHEGQCREANIVIQTGQGARMPAVANAQVYDGTDPYVIWCITQSENRNKIYEDLVTAREEIKAYADKMETLAATDTLTGLPNRRSFEANAQRDLHSADRTGQPISFVMIDIDHFKSINDSFGHAAGDQVLSTFVRNLLATARKSEVSARFGGEEFVCCLLGADQYGAGAFARRVHLAARSVAQIGRPVTVSIGIVTRQPASDLDLEACVELADAALYHAKANGRNQTILNTQTAFEICP